jgi:hypothetical protein
MFTGNF